MALVDKLSEVDILEKRLREVKDLEEKLEEADERALRIQEVIEEELGKEEVDKLREEVGGLNKQQWIQVEHVTEKVLKKSVRSTEAKEEEADELEEQIKQVFFKGVLPDEGEMEQEIGMKEVSDESLLDDSLREKLRQIEREWQDEVEKKFDSPGDVGTTTSGVVFHKVERKIQKRVATVDESGQQQEDMGAAEKTKREITEQVQEPYQVEDKDLWFIIFGRSPYKAVVKPPGTV